jgi:hypothetical protein
MFNKYTVSNGTAVNVVKLLKDMLNTLNLVPFYTVPGFVGFRPSLS